MGGCADNNPEKSLAAPISSLTPRRGRPRKFAQPSRAVTLTLPEAVLETLEAIDRDLSRAIVRLAQPEAAKRPHAPAELISFGRRAVIVVHPTKTLEQRTGVVLVPFSDGRALISFDGTMTPARLELLIQDALDQHDLPDEDGVVFESIRDVLKDARRSATVSLRQQHIMVLEFGNGSRRSAAVRSGRQRAAAG
jgi:hypothetical protein